MPCPAGGGGQVRGGRGCRPGAGSRWLPRAAAPSAKPALGLPLKQGRPGLSRAGEQRPGPAPGTGRIQRLTAPLQVAAGDGPGVGAGLSALPAAVGLRVDLYLPFHITLYADTGAVEVIPLGLAGHGRVEDLRHGRLGALDAGTRHGLARDVGVDQQVRVGEEAA